MLPFLSIVIPLALIIFVWFYTRNEVTFESSIGRKISTFQYIPSPLDNPVGFIRAILGNLLGVVAVGDVDVGLVGVVQVVVIKNTFNGIG